MRRNTAKALVNLASFLKPQRTDLIEQEDSGDAQLKLISDQLSTFSGGRGVDVYEHLLSEPLSIILDQILAPQGLNQIIYAFDFISNYLQPGAIEERYEQNRQTSTLDGLSGGVDQLGYDHQQHIFSGMLQSPAGGFIIHNHQAVYEMYPPASTGGNGQTQTLRTEKIVLGDYQNPTKANPTFGYIAILDPRFNYSRTESEIASTMTRAIPTVELSKCVPYFTLSITSTASTPNQDGIVSNNMSYNKFFEGGLTNVDVNTMSGLQSSIVTGEDGLPTSGSMDTSIGMEAFTVPQSIVPMGQPNDAWQGDASGRYSSYSSVDRARPFMSVDSFNVTESPTRAASSTQRAKMTITVHDRARLREVGDLLKPATLNRVEFTVEYGWSHPQGSEIHNNVYGQLINSMRSKGTYSLSNSSYSFTDDGQVKVTLDMVCKGAESINTIDCALTGQLAVLSDVVETSYEALAKARGTVAHELRLDWVQDLTATQHINTMTLGSVGSMVSGETKAAIDDWIRRTGGRSSPAHLRDFSRILSTLRTAATNMSHALIEDLTRKVRVLEQKSYNDWRIFTHSKLVIPDPSINGLTSTTDDPVVPLYNGRANQALETNWDTGRNKYAPLGALLQLFVVHPLHNSAQYDEVQLVTYTANLNASISAGANLGAIPIDIKAIDDDSSKTFLEILKNEYKINGGQYPINRFIRFVNETYIQPHMSVCYGFKAANNKTGSSLLSYDKDTGAVASDAIDGATQAKISKALREYYYREAFEGDEFDPRPTTFKPIDLKIVFDVSKGDSNDITATTGVNTTTNFGEKTVLRIHVFDQASGDKPGAMNILRDNINRGIIIPSVPKEPAGVSPPIRHVLWGTDFDFNDSRKICQQLDQNGILKAEAWENPQSMNEHARQSLTKRKTDLTAKLDRDTLTTRERRRFEEYLEVINVRLGGISGRSQPARAYSLDATPQRLIDYCAQAAPNIVYGEEGTVVQQISIKSKTNSRQASMFMRRALDGGGSDSDVNRGVPMRMMPADMGIDMLGNPNIKFMQKFFIKLGTGTSLDNLYGVSGLSHNITPDSFKTTLKLVSQESYGIFNSLVSNIDDVKAAIDALEQKMTAQRNRRWDDARDEGLENALGRLQTTLDKAQQSLTTAERNLQTAQRGLRSMKSQSEELLMQFHAMWERHYASVLASYEAPDDHSGDGGWGGETPGYEELEPQWALIVQRLGSALSQEYRAIYEQWRPHLLAVGDDLSYGIWSADDSYYNTMYTVGGNGGAWFALSPDDYVGKEMEEELAAAQAKVDADQTAYTTATERTVADELSPEELEDVERARAAGLEDDVNIETQTATAAAE